MITEAIKEQRPDVRDVWTDCQGIGWIESDGREVIEFTPKAVIERIIMFDRGIKPLPFYFILEYTPKGDKIISAASTDERAYSLTTSSNSQYLTAPNMREDYNESIQDDNLNKVAQTNADESDLLTVNEDERTDSTSVNLTPPSKEPLTPKDVSETLVESKPKSRKIRTEESRDSRRKRRELLAESIKKDGPDEVKMDENGKPIIGYTHRIRIFGARNIVL